MDKRNLESARMKAIARLARYKDKTEGNDVESEKEEFKRGFIRNLASNPELLEAVMGEEPERIKRLLEKYAQDIPVNLPLGIPVPKLNQGA